MSKMVKQDTGKFRTNIKDQFYTNVNVAKSCIQHVITLLPFTKDYLWIEPSAGNGSFLHQLPSSFQKIGIDIEPSAKDIIKQDYLQWTPPSHPNIIVFGNPPFGRQSSLAKSFISKSCEFAKIIAFILPKSFTKPSMYQTFHSHFHLIDSIELEKDSFMINNTKHDVPCVFQIWQKKDYPRIKEAKIDPHGFQYVSFHSKSLTCGKLETLQSKVIKPDSTYDIAIRRVGGLAGKCYRKDEKECNPQTHYFIKFNNENIPHLNTIIQKINDHVFPTNTVGPRSLSKSEMNIVINQIVFSISS